MTTDFFARMSLTVMLLLAHQWMLTVPAILRKCPGNHLFRVQFFAVSAAIAARAQLVAGLDLVHRSFLRFGKLHRVG